MALKRAFAVSLLGAGSQPGGIGAGAPEPDYFDDIRARRCSALIFLARSGSVSTLKATLGQVLDPLGRPRRLGGSAGPKSPSGIRFSAWLQIPHWDGPGAAASPEVDEDGDVGGGMIASAAIPARSWRGSS